MTIDHTRKKIAFFLPNLAGGGAEKSILNLAIAFADRGYPTDLLLASASGPFLSQIPSNLRVVDFESEVTRKSIWKLVNYLRKERPAAMLSALDHANVVAIVASRLSGVPTKVVVSIRNQLSAYYDHTTDHRLKLYRHVFKLLYHIAPEIVTVSAGVADDLSKFANIDRNRVHVIYNPIVSDKLYKQAQESVDHPWFQPGQPPVILNVGRLNPQKDQATLIKAFAKVRKLRESRLVFIGEGDLRCELETLAGQLGVKDDVSLIGFKDNPYAFMSKSAVFVLSSRHEGLPGVLIQALASGVPVVSTDCPSGPDEILVNGKYGPLVKIGDDQQMADAIVSVLDGHFPEIDSAALQPFQTDYVIEQFIELLLADQTPVK